MTDENETDVSLGDIFEESEDAETESEVQEPADEVEDAEDSTGETEETETSSEEQESEDDGTPPEKEPTLVPVAVAQSLRQKNQELKQQIEELSKYKPQANDEPDMYEDPEGWKAWNRQQIENEHLEREENAIKERVEESRSKMLEVPDYIEIEKQFELRVKYEPELIDQMFANPDPARFAYEKGKEFKDQQEKAIIERYLAENSKPEEKSKVVPMRSLATETAPTNSTKVEEEEDLKDMFGDQGY